jgi:hypothetical protein
MRIAVADVRGLLQRQMLEVMAERLAGLQVHLVLGQPHRDLRHLRGELLDLDAVELRQADLEQLEHLLHVRFAERARRPSPWRTDWRCLGFRAR